MPFLDFIPAFNAGELSPLLDARVGLEKYQAGCRTLKNFVPVSFGGIGKRPGMLYLSETENHGRKTRLEPFRYSTTTQYVLAFGHKTLRFMGDRRWVTNIGEFSHVEPWEDGRTYANGALILQGSQYYRSTAEHLSNPSNKYNTVPWLSATGTAVAWAIGTSFAAGAICRHVLATGAPAYFEAKTANTGTAGNAPLATGLSSATWLRIPDGPAFWTTGQSYVERNGIATAYTRTANGSEATSATYARAGATVTITKTAHGLVVGDVVEVDFITGGALSGIYAVATVPTADTFTITTAASGTIAGGSICAFAAMPAFASVAATYARTGTTVTVSKAAHGLAVGDSVLCDFTSGGALDDVYTVASVPDADSFTFATVASGTIAGGSTMTFVKLTEFASVAATYARSAGTVTITKANHGLVVGEWIRADFTSGTATDGVYKIATVPTANTFTITGAGTGTIAAGATLNYYHRSAHGSYYRSGTTVTVTAIAHGYTVGTILAVDFITGGALDGVYIVASASANHFTFKTAVSGTITPLATLRWSPRQIWQSRLAQTSSAYNSPVGSRPWTPATAPTESVFTLATPYTEDEIFDLQFRQINDVVIIVHPLHEPRVLTRTHADFWTLTAVTWDWPPMRDENIKGSIKLTPSATTGNITLTSTASVFDPGHVGAHWALAWSETPRYRELKVSAATSATYSSPWMLVSGRWNSYTTNYWDGIFEIHRSYDRGVTFEVVRTYKASNGDRNINASGDEAKECWMRLKFVGKRFAYGGASNYDATFKLEVTDHREWGLVKITGYVNSTNVTAEVVRELPYTTATHVWSEGAFSAYRGYPRTVALHDGRVWYGGNKAEQQRLWASVVDDFFNFRRSSAADGSIAVSIASVSTHNVQWMVSGTDALIVGTQANEYIVQPSGNTPLAPGNVIARAHSSYGSALIPGILVNYVTLFVERSRLRVREFVYSIERNGYVAADMTKLASHILAPGLKQWALQQSFDCIVWGVTTDGKLVGLTYEREENVVGWHHHETDGEVESLCVLYGSEGKGDEIYLVVKRAIDGVEKRYVELLQPDLIERQRDGEAEECVCVDSAVVTRGVDLVEVTGLDHLEGKTVSILADGAKRPDAVVVDGTITLDPDEPASVIVVGLPFEALVKTMKPEIPLRNGSSQTRGFKLHRLALRVYQSLGGQVRADDAAGWQDLIYREVATPMGEAQDLFTGETETPMDSRTLQSLEFAIRSIDPHPFTLIAVAPKFDISGDNVIFTG